MRCTSCQEALPASARFCPSCGTPRAAATAAAAERKLITVIFCDLVGSTALGEALDPETLRSVTLRYFTAMRDKIEKFGGTVEKFIGDAVMAVFGVPVMHEDDAHRALSAALGMLDAVAVLNAELEPAIGVRLQVRIGVNTGPAMAGTDPSARQALVSGDTVNTAARLEQNAPEGEILIGPLTWLIAGPAIRAEPAGQLALKGKQQPVAAYRLLGLSASPPEAGRRFDVPFVGRTRELGELNLMLDSLSGRSCAQLLTICGEPGIGKTRLVRAWRDRAARPVSYGSGRCRPYGDDGSLAPLGDALTTMLAELTRQQRQRPPPEGTDAARLVLATGLLRDGTPGPSMDETLGAVRRLLTELASQQPVVIVIDDCHWATDPLLDALERLAAGLESAVLLVCLARFELLDRRPAWRTGTRPVLTLSGLAVAETEQLAAELAETSAHWAVPERVLQAAGGNPYYLEQLLAAVTDGGQDQELPPTLQGLLGARIDALHPAERTALDLAAVLGREFTALQVAALADTGPEGKPGGLLHSAGPGPATGHTVPVALTRLTEHRFIEQRVDAAGAVSFQFSNTLLHEVTYQRMAKQTRADRHERAAELVTGEAAVGEHLESAYRYRTALGSREPAVEILRQRAATLLAEAGSRALRRSDLYRAGTLLSRAVELLRTDEPGWPAAARQLGEVRLASGQAAAGTALLREVAASDRQPTQVAHARLALAVANAGDPAAVAREVLPIFEAAGDELGQARARVRLAQDSQLHGMNGPATELLTQALAHAGRADAEPERALALGAIGVSLWRGPEPVPAALARCRRLLAEHAGQQPVVRVTLNCPLAVLLALNEEWPEARARLTESRALVSQLGYAEGAAVLPFFSAVVESLAGDCDRALNQLDEAARAARMLGAGGLPATIARETARLLAEHGQASQAADRLAAAGPMTGLPRSDAADLDGIRARILAAGDGRDEAIRLAGRAVETAAMTDSTVVRATAALDQAAVCELAGQPVQARAAAARARQLFAGKGHLPGFRRAAALHERLTAGLSADLAAAQQDDLASDRTKEGRTDGHI